MSHTPKASSSPVLAELLERGAYYTIRNFDRQADVLAKMHVLIYEGVESLLGEKARSLLMEQGLGALHEVLPADQIGALRDYVMPKIRADLFMLTCGIARKLLGITGEFFVDDYTILRINFPYVAALKAPMQAENPGIGRVDEQTRQASKAAKVVDPVYNPRAYHNNEPPPAWAHGPHMDTWTGHSRDGVNLWWAVDDVPEEASMIFYPETFGRPFAPDPRSLYLMPGFPLPKPEKMALHAGEMLVFNPEMLHGTHLNTTNRTRLALSTRINPRRPKFAASCFYAREFWHSSTNLENGRYDQVLRLTRTDNLEESPPPTSAATPLPYDTLEVDLSKSVDQWVAVCAGERLAVGAKLLVQVGVEQVILMRGARGLHATHHRCPHLDVSLMDGYHDDEAVYCPAHGVAFSLQSGCSSCDLLKLKTYGVREENGFIWLHKPPLFNAQRVKN